MLPGKTAMLHWWPGVLSILHLPAYLRRSNSREARIASHWGRGSRREPLLLPSGIGAGPRLFTYDLVDLLDRVIQGLLGILDAEEDRLQFHPHRVIDLRCIRCILKIRARILHLLVDH